MALYDTVANIVSDVAIECGLSSVSDVFASTDGNVIQLRTLLKSVGRGLILRHGFLQMKKEYTLATSGATSYSLPADFATMIDQSGWNRTSLRRLYPATRQEWQYLKAATTSAVFTVIFKPKDTTIELLTASSGETIAFEYLSRYWVTTSGQSAPDKDAPSVNTDTVNIDVQLITRALKLAFLQLKGFDTTAALDDFDIALAAVTSANVNAAPVLSLNGLGDSERLISESNAPDAGFGFDGDGGLY